MSADCPLNSSGSGEFIGCGATMLFLLLLIQSGSADESHRVTIDLSALRPSSPGLVLYKYGDLSPKLVQVDLASLNPRLQPHVIWPQFNELEVTDRPYELDSQEAIPYLTEDESLMSPRRLAKMMASANWLDQAAYDFVPDSNSLSSFQGSLPIADEVIVPLDWEVKSKREPKKKRNVFITRGWRAGGEKASKSRKGTDSSPRTNQHYTRSPLGPYLKPATHSKSRETESEEGPTSVPLRHTMGPAESPAVRVSSQESWAPPRQYWSVPHLFVNNWQ